MKTTMKLTLTTALVAALSAAAPARADDSTYAGPYVPHEALAMQVKKEIAADFEYRTAELGAQIQMDSRSGVALGATADARPVELKTREGAFWM